MAIPVHIPGTNGRRRPRESFLVASGRVRLPAERLASIRQLQAASRSANTRRGYDTDWRAFVAWCEREHYDPLPADPMVVAAYLDDAWSVINDLGERMYAPGTIAQWLSSINTAHHMASFERPGQTAEVAQTMAGIRNGRERPPARRAPLVLPELRKTVKVIDVNSWPAGVIGQRDWTMLVMGFAGAFRRSELAGLSVRDVVRHSEDGLHVTVTRSKTDQEANGKVKGLPFGANPHTCPPCAFARWMRLLAAAEDGRPAVMRLVFAADPDVHICLEPLAQVDGRVPLFRPVMKNGSITVRAISGNVVNDVVQRRVQAIGLNGAAYGAHSLRAGFVTQALRAGATHHEVMRQTDHKTATTVEIYSRETAPLLHNAVTKLGL